MNKEGYYFPHFCNARQDRKIRKLRKDFGIEGYGIYFMLLETLREQHDLMYPLEDIDLLAEEFKVEEYKVKDTIYNYELFEIDEEQKFFSPKMLVYLEPYFRMKRQRSEAGKASAISKGFNDRSTTVEQKKRKENKVNESKEEESKENFPLQGRELIWDRWFKYKAERRESYKPIGKQALLKKFSNTSDAELEAIIEQSIVSNYSGLFELKTPLTKQPYSSTIVTPNEIDIPNDF
jgi:hypothetical protein